MIGTKGGKRERELKMTTDGVERREKYTQIEFQVDENSGANVTISNAHISVVFSLVDCKRLHLFSQFTIYDKL